MTPHLSTPRLALRAFAPDDWDAIAAMLADPEATRYMHFARWTTEQRRRWFDWCLADAQQSDADGCQWAVVRADTQEVIGWFGIGAADTAVVAGERVFGYLLDRACWNQGYMTE